MFSSASLVLEAAAFFERRIGLLARST